MTYRERYQAHLAACRANPPEIPARLPYSPEAARQRAWVDHLEMTDGEPWVPAAPVLHFPTHRQLNLEEEAA